MSRTRAQASVETVVLLPALALVAVAAWQVALAAWVQDAAHAGARARLVGEPVRAVVAAALPARLRPGMRVETAAGRVTVHVRLHTLIPGLTPMLEASAPAVGP